MATLYSCFDFNPRSPHGERRIVLWMLFTLQKFQSTLPARGATAAKPIHDQMVVFQSTLPARGATCRSKKILLQRWIFQSTLPARGATAGGCNNPRLAHDFNPRSPHGERRFQIKQRASPRNFNPRSPHGERQVSNQARHLTGHFNPRSPHGERRNRDGFRPCA